VADQTAPWPKQGPASYFPSIEKKYGRSIAEWQKIIADCGLEKHMAIVGRLKSEYEMGHGHANALVGWTLAGNQAAPLSQFGAVGHARGVSPTRRTEALRARSKWDQEAESAALR